MDFAEYVRAIARPTMAFMLVVGWIIMIAENIPVPWLYEAAVVGANAWWGVDRTLKHRAERRENGSK